MTDTENTEPAARSGPTLAVLAQELGVSMRQAVALVTRAGEPLHQIWCGPEPISPEIADLARRLHRDTDPERPLFGVPPGVLARELDVAPEWLDGYVSSLLEEGRLVVWTDRGVLSAAAADEIRTLVRSEKIPDTSVGNLMTELGVSPKDIVEWVLVARRTLGDAAVHGPFDRSDPFWGEALTGAAADAIRTWARQQAGAEKTENTGEQPYDGGMAGCDRIDAHGPHRGTSSMAVSGVEHATAWRCEGKQVPGILITDPAQLPASGPCSVPGQPREAAQAASPDPEDVAELLIRQDMALSAVDDGPERTPEDTAVLEWAVRTAGHRFDPHTLWDYDLLTDAEHVHRCLDHRHTGPNTRGPVRRG